MPRITGEIHPNPGIDRPFKVVFKSADLVVGEWPVVSAKAGREYIERAIRTMTMGADEAPGRRSAVARCGTACEAQL